MTAGDLWGTQDLQQTASYRRFRWTHRFGRYYWLERR